MIHMNSLVILRVYSMISRVYSMIHKNSLAILRVYSMDTRTSHERQVCTRNSETTIHVIYTYAQPQEILKLPYISYIPTHSLKKF